MRSEKKNGPTQSRHIRFQWGKLRPKNTISGQIVQFNKCKDFPPRPERNHQPKKWQFVFLVLFEWEWHHLELFVCLESQAIEDSFFQEFSQEVQTKSCKSGLFPWKLKLKFYPPPQPFAGLLLSLHSVNWGQGRSRLLRFDLPLRNKWDPRESQSACPRPMKMTIGSRFLIQNLQLFRKEMTISLMTSRKTRKLEQRQNVPAFWPTKFVSVWPSEATSTNRWTKRKTCCSADISEF